ncbi:hypothetical protein AOQ84DRAFT_368280 [Glonium stellatum]|uniref:Uncharacterized protein n=1 Tax=Glonium stellatum TaxID=574774 RepID=A0A8E2JNE6_9PEZI|nr:hypothetical protein AOQ84DRAFT_368280 [Glonium stellatum]
MAKISTSNAESIMQTRSPTIFPFHKLNGELRNLIYYFLVCDESCFIVTFADSGRLVAYGNRSGNLPSNLTSIALNHQFRQESRSYFFTRNKFRVFDAEKSVRYIARAFLAAIGPFGRTHLRHFEMPTFSSAIILPQPRPVPGTYIDKGYNIVLALLMACKELRILRIGHNLSELYAMSGVERYNPSLDFGDPESSERPLQAVLAIMERMKVSVVLELRWGEHDERALA